MNNKSENKIISPFYFNIFFLLVILFHFILPIKVIFYPPISYLGLIIIVVGLSLNVWSVRTLKNNKTGAEFHDIPRKLVINGPFHISRNPIYLSGLIMLLGLAILFGSLITFIFPILLFTILIVFYIPIEEKKLERIFGEEYLKYKHDVRRWL
jgi:protein-S-isoprenylcysteine O-methyltransferase Ste14